MRNRKDMNQEITTLFILLGDYIRSSGMQCMLDNNRVMETVLVELLNDLYGWSLTDLNVEKSNHPAIDLGDETERLAVQVTADASRAKKIKTLQMFDKHNLGAKYDEIVFLVITSQPSIKLTESQKLRYCKYTIQYLDLNEIAKDINLITEREKFLKIHNYCMSEFSLTAINNSSQSALQPKFAPSINAASLDDFFIANGIEFDSNDLDWGGKARSEYFDEINKLNKELADLTDHERWLIYLTMKESIKYYSRNNQPFVENCFAPLSYLEIEFGNEKREIAINAINHLEHLNLLVKNLEGVASFESPHIALTFTDKDKELNYFALICQYFRDDEKDNFRLKDTIINCNFLHIT